MSELIQQRNWTEAELSLAGFQYFERKKEIIMAGRLPPSRAPLPITYTLEIVLAEAGDVICFNPGNEIKTHLADYNHWSVKPNVFVQTYKKWDDLDWVPTAPQLHLIQRGCRPYYKFVGVHARRLTSPTLIQSQESPDPALIPAGAWLVIGVNGEPWHMTDNAFRSRYQVPQPAKKSWFARR